MSAGSTSGDGFRDQAVIVTGASRGIGRAIAQAFAREGADLVLNYASNQEAAAAAAAAVEAHGRRCVLVRGSVGEPEVACRLHRAALEAFGRVDVLVNNAGIRRDGILMMLRDDTWREMVNVNLNGVFYGCRAVLETMMRQGRGAIVNVASTAGLRGRSGQVNYAATKGAVIALTRALAQEVAPQGIRVNAIAPGFIETDMVTDFLGRAGTRQAFLEATPLGRFGCPEEVAGAALYLASAASSYVTGHVLVVSGGLFV